MAGAGPGLSTGGRQPFAQRLHRSGAESPSPQHSDHKCFGGSPQQRAGALLSPPQRNCEHAASALVVFQPRQLGAEPCTEGAAGTLQTTSETSEGDGPSAGGLGASGGVREGKGGFLLSGRKTTDTLKPSPWRRVSSRLPARWEGVW